MSYSKKIIFFFKKDFLKYNLYSFNINNISFNFVGSYLCGDLIFLQILFHYFNVSIFNSKYKTYGCGSAISSINLSSFYLLNKFYYQIFFLKDFYISNKLELPSIKFHCSIIVYKILLSNLSIYKSNFILFFF